MDGAATALNSLFSKIPAPGTRDGTSVADTEGGQKVEQQADQAAQKIGETANQAAQKAGEAVDQAGQKLDESANSGSTNSGSTGSGSTGSATAHSSTPTTSTAAVAIDKVSEDSETVADQTVAPAVEHDTIKRNHETRERDVVEKEVHQDHFHTTIQPLQDREVQETEHKLEQAPTEYREMNKDDGSAEAKVKQHLEGLQEDTSEATPTHETHSKDETVLGEHVHHHHHEIIQPVIEKEIVKNTVTHVTNPIKETVQEQSEDHGVTKAAPISVDDFKHRLDGEMVKDVDPETPAV